MTAIVLALSMIGGPSAPAAAQATTAEDLARVRPDVDLAASFESCGAPLELYARLQDELLFALGAEDLLPNAARLAGVEPGAGVTGLVVVARGTGRLAITPARASASVDEPLEAATPSRRLNDSSFAIGDLSLLGDPRTPPVTPLGPSPGNAMSSHRCAWVTGRPGWLRGDGPPPPDPGVWSVLRSVADARSMALTADYSGAVLVKLRVVAANAVDAAVLADALSEFLASRRGNPNAPEAVRQAVEGGTVDRQAEVVTLRLPLSPAALDRIRHNADSRALLQLRLEDGERERWQKVGEIVRAVDVREGDSVADVGAGEGFFTVRLARQVGPKGRVFAIEVNEKAVSALGRRASAASLLQVQPVLGAADDPRLPNGTLAAVLIVNSYHEMPAYEAMLNRIFAALKPGGRLVLVEPWAKARRGEPRADQVKDHLIAPEIAEEELRRAGFAIGSREDDFVTRESSPEWLIRASRPDRASPEPR